MFLSKKNFFCSLFSLLLSGMKSGNKLLQRWLPDRRSATTILPCATRERMTRKKDHPKSLGPVSRESPLERLERNQITRESRAIPGIVVTNLTAGIHDLSSTRSHVTNAVELFSSKAAECVMNTSCIFHLSRLCESEHSKLQYHDAPHYIFGTGGYTSGAVRPLFRTFSSIIPIMTAQWHVIYMLISCPY